MFRNLIQSDLWSSDRLLTNGLTSVLSDVVKFCFAGEPCLPPKSARPLLEKLFCSEHALCHINIKGHNVLHLQAWPSWLCKGFKSQITKFLNIFYADEESQQTYSFCNLCKSPINTSLWAHSLCECKMLHIIDKDPTWMAFVELLRLGY